MQKIIVGIIAVISFMVIGVYWPTGFPYAFFGIIGLLMFGLFSEQVNSLVHSLFSPIHDLNDASDYFNSYSTRIQGWSAKVRTESNLEKDTVFLHRQIGAILSVIMLFAFTYSEYYLIAETFRSHSNVILPDLSDLGGIPMNPDLALAFCMVAGPAYWITVWTDLLGKTNFGPWKACLSEEHQASFKTIVKGFITAFAILVALMAIYRAVMITEFSEALPTEDNTEIVAATTDIAALEAAASGTFIESEPATQADVEEKLGQLINLLMYPTLSVIVLFTAGAVAYSLYEVLFLFIFLAAKLVQVAIWLFNLAINFGSKVLLWIGGLVMALVTFFITVGTWLLTIIGGQPFEMQTEMAAQASGTNENSQPEHHRQQDSTKTKEPANPDENGPAEEFVMDSEEDSVNDDNASRNQEQRGWDPYSNNNN